MTDAFAADIARLRAAFFADPDAARTMLALLPVESFRVRLVAFAAARGIALDPVALDKALFPSPLCLPNFAPADGLDWPPPGWLPTALNRFAPEPGMEFSLLDGLDLAAPFYEDLLRAANFRPFNRLLRYRMRLADMLVAPPLAAPPAGFIFHLSRCGSTLVHRMIAASGTALSFSEAAPFNEALQFCLTWSGPEPVKFQILRATVAALGNIANGKPLVLKLDAWHMMAWPLLRAAFPATPFVFLYRAPLEVMVSQRRMRGFQAVPQPDFAALFGIAGYQTLSLDAYCAHFLAASCRAAAEAVTAGAMIGVNYRDLPDAVFCRILPQFALEPGAQGRLTGHRRARRQREEPERLRQ